jgi:hypothetical protein
MDLGHRIIAMVGGVPVKVECQTCMSHHKYRRPMEDRGAERRASAPTDAGRTRSASTPRSASARAVAEAAAEAQRDHAWQARIAGKMADDFVKYSPKATFALDDLVKHFKFGDGYVVRVIDVKKIEVMFRDGPRVLAQGI